MVAPTRTGVFRMPRPADNFTMISHEFSRSRLTARAIKVGLYVLSHADGFTESQDRIARVIGLSPKTVRAALVDLERGGFLVRHLIRERGHVLGTAYGITDQPQPLTVNPPGGETPGGETPAPKKTSSRSETTNRKKTTPSGGQTADAAAPNLEASPILETEEPVVSLAEPLPLFDIPAPKIKDAGKPKAPADPSARTVVAAFVDAYRKAHAQTDPVRSAIGRVARDAKMLINEGRAAATELERAATEMGGTSYNNLPVALDKLRERGPKHTGRAAGVAASAHTDPYWQEAEQRNKIKWYNDLLTDDDAIRWARRDPSEVDRLVAEYPELADRFRDVA